jgi:hypothetical protein
MSRNTALIATILGLACAAATSAIDYGFEFSNKGGIQNSGPLDWATDHKETLWLSIPFDGANANSLALEEALTPEKRRGQRPFRSMRTSTFCAFRSFPFLRVASSFRPTLAASTHRTSPVLFSDRKSTVWNCTGVCPSATSIFLVGYTGLLNARKGFNLMTIDDASEYDTKDPYALGAVGLSETFLPVPQLIGRRTSSSRE